jgi:antitoxin ParD1/3/4
MPTQNVNLTDMQAEFIRQCVEAGEYNNASEVVRDALRLLKERKDEYRAKLDLLRAELEKGFEDHRQGRYIELNSREEIEAFGREVSRRGRERLGK